MKKAVVLGGGVAGMSVAHELCERGFAVEVYERGHLPGGKARSVPVTDTELDRPRPAVGGAHFFRARRREGHPWVPGEHGFRFFPGFYRHVIDTMSRIPVGGGRSAADNLVDTTETQVARFDRASFNLPIRFPHTPDDVHKALMLVVSHLAGHTEVSAEDTSFVGERLWQFVTSCRERRLAEYEKISWWDFIQADRRGPAYQKIFGNAITRSLVAAKARQASARTIGKIFTQILFDIVDPTVSTADRVLNGPTNDVWITPWLEYLRARGVRYEFGTEVKTIECHDGRVVSATVARGGRTWHVGGDHFFACVPVERMTELISPEMLALDPSLGNLHELAANVDWMNGIQFYLSRDIEITHGHTIYIDAPWALTSVSQAQFWRDVDMSAYGDGRVRGVLSVDISEWEVPGLSGKSAKECSREEIAKETWAQLERSLNVGGARVLRDEDLLFWYLDRDIVDSDPLRPGVETNLEPLLVNYVDTWRLRPEAWTRIPNLFLASDYVRTHTDLATMEAANEAARRAVNAMLAEEGLAAMSCAVTPLHEPEALAPWRAWDRVRFHRGEPWDGRATAALEPLLATAAQGTTAVRSVLPGET